jgi:hypothetical protein
VQRHLINIKKYTLAICLLTLSGCAFTNQWLNLDGDKGTKENIPVAISILHEMATYCEKVYDHAIIKTQNNEFAYNIAQDRGVTILSFRGTDNKENVITDIDVRPFKDKKLGEYLHRGFRDAAEKLYNHIIRNNEFVPDHKLHDTILLTGHSLGGAMAQIIGLWLDDDGYDVQIYTFGSPKISNVDFGDDDHFRVYLKDDPIPFLPPFPYIHWGTRINAKTLEWETRHPVDDFLKIDARDHSIKEYLKVLEKHEP